MKLRLKAIVFFLALCSGIQMQAQETRQITVFMPDVEGPQTIMVTVIDGQAYWCEDIALGPIDELVSGRGGGASLAVSGGHNYRWPGGVIPYEITASHPFTRQIRRAIDTLNARTNLRIRAKTSTDLFWVRFVNRSTGPCASPRGRRLQTSQPQEININTNCDWDSGSNRYKSTYGSIMHEILHAAGLFHEQKRADRNTCITMNATAYAALDASWQEQWNTIPLSNSVVSPNYDLNSIMHYPAGSAPMFTVTPACSTGVRPYNIGQRYFLSAGDIAFVNSLYPNSATSAAAGAVAGSVAGAAVGVGAGAAGTAAGAAAGSAVGGAGRRGSDSDASSSFDVRYNVQLVPQPTSMSCWASSAAMIYGWLRNVRINVDEIRSGAGVWGNFPTELRTGLNPDDVRIFQRMHFCCEAPMCYTVDGFRGLLENYGPLWVAGAVPGAHVRVVYGIFGDGTPDGTRVLIHDPWGANLPTTRAPTTAELAANRGQSYERTFAQLMSDVETLGGRPSEMAIPGAIYVVHAPAAGGGACSCGN